MKQELLDQFNKETGIIKPVDTDLDYYQSQYITWLEQKVVNKKDLLQRQAEWQSLPIDGFNENETIWKFELEVTDNQFIEMPKGARLLAVQAQFDKPCLWALVDPKAEKEKRCFEMFGTGHVISSGMGTSREYIGTYQLYGGSLVFHVFEYTGV